MHGALWRLDLRNHLLFNTLLSMSITIGDEQASARSNKHGTHCSTKESRGKLLTPQRPGPKVYMLKWMVRFNERPWRHLKEQPF